MTVRACVFGLFFVVVLLTSGISFGSNNQILNTLDKINTKLDVINSNISSNTARLSSLETWKEQQSININRFYQVNWASAEDKITRLEDSVNEINNNLSELDGLLKILSFIAFILHLVVPLLASYYFHVSGLNKKKNDLVNSEFILAEIKELRESRPTNG